jgi:hypothetical protein
MLKEGYAKHAVHEKVMETELERNYVMCALCKVRGTCTTRTTI